MSPLLPLPLPHLPGLLEKAKHGIVTRPGFLEAVLVLS